MTKLDSDGPEQAVHGPYPYLQSFVTYDYKSAVDQITEPYRHTCSWIPKMEVYQKWSNGEHSRILWIHGFPGLGKSVIAKYMLSKVLDMSKAKQDSRRCVLYFFCSFRDNSARSYKGLMTSLIHQLLSYNPSLAIEAQSLKTHRVFIEPDLEDLHSLRKIFADLLGEYYKWTRRSSHRHSPSSAPTLHVVIDALDELDNGDWSRFFETIDDILREDKSKQFRVMITSRTEHEIEQEFKDACNIDLGTIDQNALDVAEFIRGTVSDYGQLNDFGDENTQEIISQLTTKAEGMFLWATLAWALFTDGVGMWTKALVQRKLDGLRQLPSGIESLYHRIFSLVDTRIAGELLAALKWLAVAQVPLTIDEVAIALALRPRPRKQQHLEIPFNMRGFFKTACPHLVKIDKSGAIRLVHLSLKTYLLETEVVNNGVDWVSNAFYFDSEQVNFDVGLDCLSYITLEDFAGDSLEQAHKHVFFSYSHKYWIEHLDFLQAINEVEGRCGELSVYFFRLLDFETKKLRFYDTSKMIFRLWDTGLGHLFEPAVRFGVDLNVFDEKGNHLIHHVCDNFHPEEMELIEGEIHWLVGLGVDLNGRNALGQTVLHRCISIWHEMLSGMQIAAWSGTGSPDDGYISDRESNERLERGLEKIKDAANRLLSHPNIDINAMDKHWYTPLSYTIYWGMSGAMNMLLECQYFEAEKGHRALHIAAKEGAFSTVERLLERGVDITGLTTDGQTALHLAAAKGHYRILKLLVEHATPKLLNSKDMIIDPNDRTTFYRWTAANGWTALHLAVTSGNDDMVLWLVNHPWIDLNVKDKHDRRAIAFAAAFGSRMMLEGFLTRDPTQITHKDLFGNGLLHMASFGGNRENFEFLLSRDQLPDRDPNKWGNNIADLVPTQAMDEYLHGIGFAHSEKRKRSCLSFIKQQQQQIDTGTDEVESDSSKWIVLGGKDDGWSPPKGFPEGLNKSDTTEEERPPDALGRRYGKATYYAIDK